MGTSEPQPVRRPDSIRTTYHVAVLVAHDLNLDVAGTINVPESLGERGAQGGVGEGSAGRTGGHG